MAQQYYSMDQIAKLAQVSQQQVYYLINMKFKFKPTLTDPSGNKFYDERAVGQIFQELGKVLPKSAASPATDNGLLDINALAETTGLGKKKLRIFLREHKDLKPDFVDEKNHNKKYWGPSAIQYINDHFGAEEAKAEEKTTQAEEKTTEVEGKAEAAEVVEAAKTEEKPAEEEKQEQASQVEDENKEETIAEKAEKSDEPANDQQFVVRKRTNDDKRGRGNYGKRRNNQRNGYQNQNRTNNYSKRRELFAGKMKLVTEKGTFYTDQFASLEELAEYVFSSKDSFMKVEKYNRGEFSPAYISTKIIIEFEEV
ncbi:hypothetical protein [Lactobacillus delbrueckii]|uniref:hypothetical protein n=1 Tax=Lactobacillus delbrueckii TaxID=1584 RepID=UPI001013C188|nr:hypothetical protein [Lactobacillus delbrueckii]RXS39123.1 hypothetical protein EST31_09000 [Lactobacillus delbrueckii subsp. bulgaricus]